MTDTYRLFTIYITSKIIYYTKVSRIPNGNKLIKRYDILTCEDMTDIFTCEDFDDFTAIKFVS